PGGRSLERRNPASQTIILRLSQCSSKVERKASPAILQASYFPVKPGESEGSEARGRLTAGLPVVGTERALPRDLIRLGKVNKAAQRLLGDRPHDAVIAV